MRTRIAVRGVLGAILAITFQEVAAASPEVDAKIAALASTSSCAQYVWKERGRAPIGYVKGMALTYAKSYCELNRKADTAVSVMAAESSDPSADAKHVHPR